MEWKKGGYSIPEDDVRRRYNERDEALKGILPYCYEGSFFDNDNDFHKVAEYRNGEITALIENKPTWLEELIAALSIKNNH